LDCDADKYLQSVTLLICSKTLANLEHSLAMQNTFAKNLPKVE